MLMEVVSSRSEPKHQHGQRRERLIQSTLQKIGRCTALRQLEAQRRDGASCFLEKIVGTGDDVAPRMTFPSFENALIDRRSFCGIFDAQGIRLIVVVRGRRTEMEHAMITSELSFAIFFHRLPHALWSRPVRSSIHGSAVAENDGELVAMISDLFELALDTEDSPLRRSTFDCNVAARKSAGE